MNLQFSVKLRRKRAAVIGPRGEVAAVQHREALGIAPSAITLDINLPDQSGFQLLDELKAADISVPTIFLTGNVDEWTRTVREGERPSILKGGYWGPVRTRCRPATRSHDENHIFYQQGTRCCADLGAELKKRGRSDDPSRAPRPRELK